MEEDPAPLQVGPHLGAGLHALVLKPQLLHPNLTHRTIVNIQNKQRIVENVLRIRYNSLTSAVYHHHTSTRLQSFSNLDGIHQQKKPNNITKNVC
jgi:hypothetical protein